MSCYSCSRKYGLFCKEYGCPNCGYSYCGKCLKRPMPVPRHNNKVFAVCLICYDKLSKLQATAEADKFIDCETLPGELVTKLRLPKNVATPDGAAADELLGHLPDSVELMATVLAPTSITNPAAGEPAKADIPEFDVNLDNVIKKRLRDLQAVETTDDDIRARLSNLSGMPHQKNYDKKDLLLNTDQRTDEERIRDLVRQFLSESELDERVENERTDAIGDIETRLRALRDAPIEGAEAEADASANTAATNTPSDNEDENDEAALKKIILKYLAESKLPETNTLEAELGTTNNNTNANNEELPWCNICNEDAVFRCLGCDGELFCAQCYRECHDDEEYRAHVKEKYTVPPKFKENHF